VHKHVRAAHDRDEAVALVIVEPFTKTRTSAAGPEQGVETAR
jgi:hypothetical protein